MFSKKTSPQARRSPAQQEAFFRNRRKALIYSGSVGLSALTGCETLPPALRQLAAEDDSVLTPRVPAFERKGAQARAASQAIFRQVDNRQPVVPAQAPQGLSAPLIAAAKGYEKTKRTLLASLAPGQRISYEDTATLVGPAVAGVLRTLFNEIAAQERDTQTLKTARSKPAAPRRQVERRGTVVTIPHGHMLSYVQKGYCMDPSLPAPGRDDAFEIWHVSERVPKELVPLFQAVGKWAALPQNKGSAQSLTWAIMGAGTESSWAKNISQKALAQMDEAMPGGARAFASYHNSQMLARALIKKVMKSTKLDRYIDPNQLLDNNRRDAAANELLQELIRQGQAMPGGKGVGYTMLAPNVAARSTGDATLSPKVQVVNVSGQDFDYELLDWFAQPVAPKQGTSATNDITAISDTAVPVQEQGGAAKDEERGKFLNDFLKDLSKFAAEGLLDSFAKHAPAASNAIARGASKAAQAVNLPRNVRKPLIEAAASAVSAVPVVGNVLSAYEFISGKDWYTGDDLSAMERAGALLGTVPGANALKAVSKAWKVSAAAGALRNAANNSALFRLVDKTEGARTLNDFIWSDTANNISSAVAPDSALTRVLDWNAGTKETASQVLAASWATLPWQKPVAQGLKAFSQSAQKYLPGLEPQTAP